MPFTRLNPCYQLDRITSNGDRSLFEIAAPLITGTVDGLFASEDDILFLEAEIKKPGEGDPASNLRFKQDVTTNNTVVQNVFTIFKNVQKPK